MRNIRCLEVCLLIGSVCAISCSPSDAVSTPGTGGSHADATGGAAVKNLKAPWGVIGGDADTTFNWTSISAGITGSTQPAFGAALTGIDHNRVAGQPKGQEAYIAWMRWRFMGDQAGHDMFVGPACTICTDTATFSAFVKTASLDSL